MKDLTMAQLEKRVKSAKVAIGITLVCLAILVVCMIAIYVTGAYTNLGPVCALIGMNVCILSLNATNKKKYEDELEMINEK